MSTSLSISDPVSHANLENFKIKHININWTLDFTNERLFGYVEHDVECINNSAKEMYLDCEFLNIEKVTIDGNPVKYKLDRDASIWSVLSISIDNAKKNFKLAITYSTTDANDCKALQWMKPELTQGKRQPYVYSQCQAINARYLLPCQDTPSNKASYSAKVKAQKGIEVLMSAVKQESTEQADNFVCHEFHQKIPVPSYLIALAAGDIKCHKIGRISKIWCEPELLDEASYEFAEIDKYLDAAIELCGPYEWQVYDVLVLPPTFPYGGMENPCLTFVTPTLISGDRSQVYVIAHEIAHSWTGNLVTNSNWDGFWINEGHTNYLERLILERVYNNESYRHMHIKLGLAELQEAIHELTTLFGQNHEFLKLVPRLVNVDPDEAFSRVPYEKGSFMLFYLENKVGKERMMTWLKSYIKTFRLLSINTEQWKSYFLEFMKQAGVSANCLEEIDWNAWFYNTGALPVDAENLFDRSLIDQCEKLANQWIEMTETKATAITETDKQNLIRRYKELELPSLKCYFLRILYNVKQISLPHSTLNLMNQLYELSSCKNMELVYGWFMLCLLSRYETAADDIFKFLNSNGRLMYNRPLYKKLFDWSHTRQRSLDNFNQRHLMMHPVTRGEIHRILEINSN